MLLDSMSNSADVICLQGNGACYGTLKDAGAEEADIFVAVTNSDLYFKRREVKPPRLIIH